MAGRHWMGEPPEDQLHRLICLYFGEPAIGAGFVVRSCRCGAQLWVATAWLPAVEDGTLIPTCWWCYESTTDAAPQAVVVDESVRWRRRELPGQPFTT